jgi:hypothetical protein
MAEIDMETALAASGLDRGDQAALISALVRKNVISAPEGREIYEQALLMLEASQADAPASKEAFDAAREPIEARLRP